MCQRDNNPTKRKTTVECHQWVFLCSETLKHPKAYFNWPLNKNVYKFIYNGRHAKLRNIHKKLRIKNHSKLTKVRGSWLGTSAICGGLKHVFEISTLPIPLTDVEKKTSNSTHSKIQIRDRCQNR